MRITGGALLGVAARNAHECGVYMSRREKKGEGRTMAAVWILAGVRL